MKATSAKIFALLLVVLPSATALAAREYQTPSGRPEAVFVNTSPEEASNKIAALCVKQGWTPSRQSMQVTCEYKINGFSQALTNVLTAPRYATSVRHFISFNLIQDGRQTLAQARQYQAFTTAFGQYNETELANDNAFNSSIDVMLASGAVLPIGTRFPDKSWWGIEFFPDANLKSPTKIASFNNPSPAKLSGLIIGDEVVAVNGKKCKNIKECFKISDSLNIGSDIIVQVIREKQILEFKWIVSKRPDVAELEGCNNICLDPIKNSLPLSRQDLSIAEEIERLGLLHEKGIITEQEFQAAKNKLLDLN
jgi:hypothetical protein